VSQYDVKSWTEFRDENLVKQQYDYSCGAASLATVLKYFFNEEVTEKEIIKALPAQRELNEEKMKTSTAGSLFRT
jgi:predicted double-glycine peptidase